MQLGKTWLNKVVCEHAKPPYSQLQLLYNLLNASSNLHDAV